MSNHYDLRMGWADRLAPDATRRRATATWARAMTAHLPRLDDRQRLSLARAMFQGRGVCNNEQECIDVPKDFPGFDRFPLGMMALDAWRAGGYPLYPQTGGDIGFVDEAVGPCGRSAEGKWSARYGGNRGFYQQSFATDATRRRFADELLRRGDPKLVEQAFAHAELIPSDRVVAMLRLLDGHPRELAAALQVSREHLAGRLREDDPLHRDLVRRGALPTQPQPQPTPSKRQRTDGF